MRYVLPLLLLVLALPARAQGSLDVTFRFLPDLTAAPVTGVQRVFVPGSFNDWGPNNKGLINPAAPSLATYDTTLAEWRYTTSLRVGYVYTYKIHYHRNSVGSDYVWLTDPLNPVAVGPNSDSQVTVTDPMVFQLAREQEGTGAIVAVSAGIFSSQPITALTFEVNGAKRDGMAYFDPTTRLFRYVLPAPVAPGAQFKVSATDAFGRTAIATVGTIPPVVVDEKRPAGLEDGITYGPGGRVTLSLFAPHHQYAYAIGDFSSWEAQPAFLMKRDSVNADSVYFWTSLNLDADGPVRFQYLVDGLIRVADPYSTVVLDPNHDNASLAYGGFPPYPAGQTSEIVGVLQKPRATAPSCDATGYTPPRPENLVIYELLLRDFQDAHSFSALADTLDYFKKLGVTALELMPVAEFDGNLSWGYNPAFHFAVDKYYGSPESLKRLVEQAHCRGIAVLLDVVYNHATGQSPLVRLWNTSLTGSPAAPASSINPYANTSARHPFNVFTDLNHDSPATRYWLGRANRYWLDTFGVDGFRYDLSKGFTQCPQGGPSGCPNNQGQWDSYDASRIANLKRMADGVWSTHPDALLVLEHLAGGAEERELATYRTDEGRPGFLLWRKVMGPFNEATMGYGSNLAGAYFGAGGQGLTVPNSVSNLEDHDEQRLMRKNARYGNTGPDGYDVKTTATALDRMKAAGAFFFTLPGPKMIWQFGELGYGAANDECLPEQDACPGSRTDSRADGWAYRGNPAHYALYQTWSALLALRHAHPVFTSPQTQVSLNVADFGKRIGLSLDTMQAVVVGNFGVAPREVNPAFGAAGTWYDYFGGTPVAVADVDAPFMLAPGAFRVFTNHFVGYAPAGTGVDVAPGEGASAFGLDGVAPNPARGAARIAFTLDRPGPVRLDVYDALGRRVLALLDAPRAAGPQEMAFSVSALPAGLYLVRLERAGQAQTRPFVVVR